MSYRGRSGRDCFRVALIAGIAVALLAACSTLPPEYRPKSPTGTVGFNEMRLAPDQYRVEFSGSTTSSRREVENRLTQRAAEVTLQSGYTHFVINVRDTEVNTTRVAGFVPDNYLHGPYYFPRARRWSNIPLAFEGLQTNYVATADIAMLRTDQVP
jgi:hypothetical protein